MDLTEIKFRSVQYAHRWAERFHVSKQSRLISDREFTKKINLLGSGSKADLLRHFRNRDVPVGYPSFECRKKTISALQQFRNTERSILAEADEIYEGHFRFFGSDRLRFGGRVPDWHFEPLAGKRSPMVHWTKIDELSPELTGDKKVIWELNRHQYFSTLGQAYWLTGDEKYATTFVEHIESWMDGNPPKLGVNWVSSLELAFRSISWIWAIYFFRDSRRFTPELLVRLLKYLYLQGRHIETYLSTYYSPNTHLTGEALGLYYLGTFLPELEDAPRWKEAGYRILMNALDFQVRADGTYCEQSSHYLRYTIDFYCNLLILLRLECAAVDPKLITKLNHLFDFLLHITQPNCSSPSLGDDDGGRLLQLDGYAVTDLRPAFALGAVLLDRSDLKYIAGSAGPEILWLLGADEVDKFDRLEVTEPASRMAAFTDGGFYAVRSDWTRNADALLINCGPFGFLNGGHSHAHTLSFLLTVAGEPIFVDSGTYNYTSEPQARDYFRSSAAHNCLTVNGESSSVTGGPFSWKSTASARLLELHETDVGLKFKGSHDGFERFGVGYEREFVFEKNGTCEVIEHLDSRQRNCFQLNFVLSPFMVAAILDIEMHVVLSYHRGGPVLSIKTNVAGDSSTPGTWSLEECLISPTYGSKIRSHKLVYTLDSEGRFQIRNCFVKIKK